jgi:hypothetical protein
MAVRTVALVWVTMWLGAGSGIAQSKVGSQAAKPPGKRVRVDLSGFDLDKSKSGGTQVGGASRGGQKSSIVLDAPRQGLAYSTHPFFQWHDSEDSREAIFRIFDASGDELFETNLQGTSLSYPADAPELRPGSSYSWTVQHRGEVMVEPAVPAVIRILPESERKQLAALLSNDAGRKDAATFVSKRLWYDSIEAYSKLIAQYPKSPELYRRRGEIYSQFPATEDLAERDFQQADRLK